MAVVETNGAARETAPDGGLDAFIRHRPLLFGIAYRMLGSVADAEDVVQEAFLRWRRAADEEIASPRAWLAAVVTRLCIDHLRLARVRREEYIGPWLPEPLEVGRMPDPAEEAELADSLSLAFLVLLERLTPVERAVFLLHDVFDFGYAEIAPLVGRGEATCRQVAHRARAHVGANRPRFRAAPEVQERLVLQFARACADGDLSALLATLTADVTVWSDGGGKAHAARKPIEGADKAARYLIGITKLKPADMTVRSATINGGLALVAEIGGRPYSVVTFDIERDRIAAIRLVVNPDKLSGVGEKAKTGEGRGTDASGEA